jgi:micrococcal nuclease
MLEPSLYVYRAKVIKVVDGDTLDLSVDLGMEITKSTRVRLIGINCPETNTPEGKQAKAYVEAWCLSNPEVLIHTTKDRKEKYGRYLATVVSPGIQGQTLNQLLLDVGLAAHYA